MTFAIVLGIYYSRYVPLIERSKSIEFNDFLEDAKVPTGLIKNDSVEEKLNKAGIFDSEIRKFIRRTTRIEDKSVD